MNIRFAILVIVVVLCPVWAQEAPFGSGLFQVMEKAACRSCHNADGVASATRLQFPEPEATPAYFARLEMRVPEPPRYPGKRFASVDAALADGPKFFEELMSAVGSRA